MNFIAKEILNGYVIEENTPDHDIHVIENDSTIADIGDREMDAFKRTLEKICKIYGFDDEIEVTIVKEK